MDETCTWGKGIGSLVWKGECGIIVNVELHETLGGFAFFHYCPNCGKEIEVLC